MITNKTITYYKKSLGNDRLPVWTRYVFENVWVHSTHGSNVNKGFENSNSINVRIPMEEINDRSIFDIEDIIAIGEYGDITQQNDLQGKEFYNVRNVTINDFGNNPHVHLGGS